MHRRKIRRNLAPGGLFVRVETSSDVLLDCRPMTNADAAGGLALNDRDLALSWIDAHPDEHVHIHVYDGDTGRQGATLILGIVQETPTVKVAPARRLRKA